jgi:hypothetical protein
LFSPNRVAITTQRPGTDEHNRTASSQVFASRNTPNFKGPPCPVLFLGEMPASQQEAVIRLNHAVELIALDQLEAVITVPGWLVDNGQLWISLAGGTLPPITIYSPMLFPSEPNGMMSLLVKGVKHSQSNEGGTLTEITCALRSGFGNQISTTAT